MVNPFIFRPWPCAGLQVNRAHVGSPDLRKDPRVELREGYSVLLDALFGHDSRTKFLLSVDSCCSKEW